jgi:hypothetical protein
MAILSWSLVLLLPQLEIIWLCNAGADPGGGGGGAHSARASPIFLSAPPLTLNPGSASAIFRFLAYMMKVIPETRRAH